MKFFKKLFLPLTLIALCATAADVKISELPLSTSSDIHINDSFPYVDSVSVQTKRYKLSDLPALSYFSDVFASLNSSPTFTGVVTGSSFVGNLTGNASNVSGTVAINHGGTGQVSANAALNALLPSQSTFSGDCLTTDGSNTSWGACGGGGGGGVSSVGLADGSTTGTFSISNSPITSSGTISIKFANQASGAVLAGPLTGSSAEPAFRRLVGDDLPFPASTTKGGVLSKSAAANNFLTGLSTGGVLSAAQPAFTDISGSVAASQLPNPSASTLGGVQSHASVSHEFLTSISTSGVPVGAQPAFTDISGTLAINAGGTGQVTANAALNAFLPSQASASGDCLTSDGTNTSWGACGSGGGGSVSSVGLVDGSTTGTFSISNSPVTSSGNISIKFADQASGAVLAGPVTGSNGQPVFRRLIGDDLPNPAGSTKGGVLSKGSVASNFLTGLSVGGVFSAAQPAFTDISGTLPSSQFRQSVAQSVVGNSTNATANVADISASAADQILRATGAGTSIGFGSIDLSKSGAVGSSLLGSANGGTGTDLSASTGVLTVTAGTVGPVTRVGLSQGGTNNNIVAAAGAPIYSTASAIAVGTAGNSGQVLGSGGTAAPAWQNPDPGNGLTNPNFQAATTTTGWTVATGTASDDTTDFLNPGTKSLKITASSQQSTLTQDFTPTGQTLGVNYFAGCYVNTTLTNVQVVARIGGANYAANPVPSDGAWHLVGANFPGPANGTSIGVQVGMTSSGSGSFDNQLCGVAPANIIGTVAQAKSIGTLSFAETSSCTWAITQSSYSADFSANSSCPSATIVGGLLTSPSKTPQATYAAAANKTYEVDWHGRIDVGATVGGKCRLIDDASNVLDELGFGGTTSVSFPYRLHGEVTYTTAASHTWRVQCQTSSSSVTIQNQSGTGYTGFEVTEFPTASQQVVQLNQIQSPKIQELTSSSGTFTLDTGVTGLDIEMCGGGGGGGGSGTASGSAGGAGGASTFGTTLLQAAGGGGGAAGGGSTPGSGGTPGTTGTTSLGGIQGSILPGNGGINGVGAATSLTGDNFTGGAGAGSPVFGGGAKGTAHNSAGAAGGTNSGAGGAGGGSNAATGAGTGGGGASGDCVHAFISSSSASFASSFAYVTGAAGSAGTAGTSGLAGGAGAAGRTRVTEYFSYNMPVVALSVTSGNNLGSEQIGRAYFAGGSSSSACSSSPCTVYSQTGNAGNWLIASNPVTRSGTGAYVVSVVAGQFSATPVCTCTAAGIAAAYETCQYKWYSSSATSLQFFLGSVSTAGDDGVNIVCVGPH